MKLAGVPQTLEPISAAIEVRHIVETCGGDIVV